MRSSRCGPPSGSGGTPVSAYLGGSGGCCPAVASTTSRTTVRATHGSSSASRISGRRVMSQGFVHLHVHSQFSFMDGAASLPGLVDRAAELEMVALALTDHQGLSGAIRFYQACKKAGIAPIIGCEVVVETAGILGEEADLPPE